MKTNMNILHFMIMINFPSHFHYYNFNFYIWIFNESKKICNFFFLQIVKNNRVELTKLVLVLVTFNGFKGILSTSCVIFSYPKLLSISILTFIKWRLNTELLMNTLRNVVFSTKKADHRYRKLSNYAQTWARPTLFIYLFLCQ